MFDCAKIVAKLVHHFYFTRKQLRLTKLRKASVSASSVVARGKKIKFPRERLRPLLKRICQIGILSFSPNSSRTVPMINGTLANFPRANRSFGLSTMTRPSTFGRNSGLIGWYSGNYTQHVIQSSPHWSHWYLDC